MKTKTLPTKILTVALLILGLVILGLGGAVALTKADPYKDAVQARASRLFEMDSKKIKALPSNQLIALSVALEFGNYKGAESIINKLERL